jgi:peptidoglycan/LPS O-acetylase OafA/YrhL
MQPADRLHALDAVRAYALLLGVVLHGAAAFLQGFPIPMWLDRPSDGAPVIYYVIHMFRMSAFFLIAGFFARVLVERRGVKAFVKDRAKRVALPLVLFSVVVGLTAALGFVLGALPHGVDFLMSLVQTAQPQAGAAPAPQAAAAGAAGGFNLGHLWFLYYLLIFYVLALAIRWLVHAVDPRGALAAVGDRVVAFAMRGVWGPALIALPIAAYLYSLETWAEWLGLPAPFSIVPSLTALVGYGIAFGLGWVLNRQVQALLDLQKIWYVYLVLAVDDLLPRDDRHGAAVGGRQSRGHAAPALYGCLRGGPMVLGLRVRRRGGAVLVDTAPRHALSRRCVVLGVPDALVDADFLHHAAAAIRLALEHQARDLCRRLDADPARDVPLSRALHLDRRDVERPPPCAAGDGAACAFTASSRTLN